MYSEELKRLNAKWAVFSCLWDSVRKTNIPSTRVSPIFETREEAYNYLRENYPNAGNEYWVFKTDRETGFY